MKIFELLQQYIFYPVEQLMELMKSSAISEYLFGGHINLFYVVVTFVVGLMIVRFFLRPFTTGTVGVLIKNHNRQVIDEKRQHSDEIRRAYTKSYIDYKTGGD